MNILILNWRDPGHPKAGGAEVVTMKHAAAWAAAGNSVTWFTSSYSDVPHDEVVSGVRMMRRAGSLTVYALAPLFLLFNGHTFDVIVDEIHGIPFFAPLFTRKPVVAFIHEIAGDIWDYMFPFPVNAIGKWLESSFFRVYRKNLFWTDAPSTIDELAARGIPRKNCTAIPCPITVHDPGVIASAKKEAKASHPTFIFVSRIVKMKGIEEVVKAFSFIRQELPDAELVIVGGGEQSYVRQLVSMIREYGVEDSVRFSGRVTETEKFRLMATSHILLHASVKEGWGLVVLEAAAVGTPSVVYNVPGLRDIVRHGQTGVVVDTNSPRDMAVHALKLFRDEKAYAKMRKNGMAWAESLKWDDVARASMEVLKKAQGGHA